MRNAVKLGFLFFGKRLIESFKIAILFILFFRRKRQLICSGSRLSLQFIRLYFFRLCFFSCFSRFFVQDIKLIGFCLKLVKCGKLIIRKVLCGRAVIIEKLQLIRIIFRNIALIADWLALIIFLIFIKPAVLLYACLIILKVRLCLIFRLIQIIFLKQEAVILFIIQLIGLI